MTAAAPSPTATAPAPLLALHARRKLIPIEFLMTLHGLEAREAFNLVEEGTLYPCFDLSSSRTRRKVHIWRGVVEQYRPGQRPLGAQRVDDVIASVLPPGPALRASDLAFRCCLSPESFVRFIAAGDLREIGRRNPINETPKIDRASAVKFLQARAV